jgi:soluble lytic murein transglycosylase-like protein
VRHTSTDYVSLFDPITNIRVATTYLNILVNRAGDLTVALDRYGTGSGYGASVIGGKAVLDANPADPLPS